MEIGEREKYSCVDTIIINHPLYQILDDVLHKIGCCGDGEVVNGDELRNRYLVRIYKPKFHLWRLSIDNLDQLLETDEDLVLTRSSNGMKDI